MSLTISVRRESAWHITRMFRQPDLLIPWLRRRRAMVSASSHPQSPFVAVLVARALATATMSTVLSRPLRARGPLVSPATTRPSAPRTPIASPSALAPIRASMPTPRMRARSAGRLQTCCARRPSMVASACERDEHCPRPLLHVAPTHRPLHRRRCALASQCAITTTSTARSLPSLGLAASSSFPPRACGLSWRRACGYETDTLPPPHCADPHRTRACTPRSPAWCLRALSLSDCTCWQLGEMTP